MTAETWILIGDLEAAALAIGGVIFLITYTFLARWWEVREGWFISLASMWMTAIFGYIAASRFEWLPPLDDSSTRVWLRLVIFTGFAVALIWVSGLLILAQIEIRKKEASTDADHRIPGHRSP